MSLRTWENKGHIQKVAVNYKTLETILNLVKRDLEDCQLEGLSSDRKFATAYGAALNLASYIIKKEGFRVAAKAGHHKITFDIAGELLGKKAADYINFFDFCRRKRNKVDYDQTNVVSETEVKEIISKVKEFKDFLKEANHI